MIQDEGNGLREGRNFHIRGGEEEGRSQRHHAKERQPCQLQRKMEGDDCQGGKDGQGKRLSLDLLPEPEKDHVPNRLILPVKGILEEG